MDRPLRVALDATAIPREVGGVGRYLEALVPALAGHGIHLIVICQQHDAARFADESPDAEIVALPAHHAARARRLIWEQTGLPRLLTRVRADVLHSPHYTRPLLSRVPVVITLHDATFFSLPEVHSRLKRNFFRWWTRSTLRSRRAVAVVPSEATRTELERFVARRRAPIVVAHHGYDPAAFHVPTAAELAEARAELGLPAEWLAFLGTVEPRKNVANLVRAYARLLEAGDAPPPLVIAGAPGWDTETAGVVDALPPGADVRLAGYVPRSTLAGFLGGATVFVYPSRGEGFGLPVVEAMASGGPVLTTRELALAEVGGDAVAYTGLGVDEIAGSLRALLQDPAERRRIAQLGPGRAAGFTWARSAKLHVDAFRTAYTRTTITRG